MNSRSNDTAALIEALGTQKDCFVGDKRTAWAAMRAFLIINGVELECDQLEAIRFVEQVAAGELTFEDVTAWIGTRIDTPH